MNKSSNYLEVDHLRVSAQAMDFPEHFHETFCISLIHKGVEYLKVDGQSLYSESGSLSITNPYEVHANPLIDAGTPVAFDTLYIPQDVMKYFLRGKNISFLQRKINDNQANDLFRQIKKALVVQDFMRVEVLLTQFVSILDNYAQDKVEDYTGLEFNRLEHLVTYIDQHINKKFTLDHLAKVAHINKYGLTKKFRRITGMSLINYILMKKIFASKKQITAETILTELAFNYDFSDMAHYSKTFKRFIGLSPKVYQKNLP